MRPRPLLIVALVGALGGLVFAGFSTYDFARHLDRQVHSVHCSFVPGLGEKEVGGSGCEATLKSPYSSFLRTYVWGGVPISLPAMSVFAFLIFFGADIFLAGRQTDPRATGFYALGSMLPVLASAVMGYLSFAVIDAACKLCIGIYVSSAVTAIGAVGLWLRAGGVSFGGGSSLGGSATPRGGDPAWVDEVDEEDDSGEMEETDPLDYEPGGGSRGPDGPTSWGKLAGAFGLGVLFVAVPVGAYVTAAPDHSQFIGTCGSIDSRPDSDLMVPMGDQQGAPALEVFDPLCPTCRAFEQRLKSSGLDKKLARKAVMFPLDKSCNWMLDRQVHAGACAVSEAVLCAGSRADEVVDWAFEHQSEIRSAAEGQPDAARRMVEQAFPELERCVGSPEVQTRLNRSLRWAVKQEIKVLTPQLYVDGVRLCDEDVDLGLEYALTRMIRRQRNGTLVAQPAEGDDS